MLFSSGQMAAGPLFCRERCRWVLQPPIVAECQYNYAAYHRPHGYGQEPQRKAPSRIPHQPHRVRAEEAAEIADRVDQGDPARGGTSSQHGGGERPESRRDA